MTALPLSPSVVAALSGGPRESARWPRVILFEIALAAALCAAGVLADRRVRSGRRVTAGPG